MSKLVENIMRRASNKFVRQAAAKFGLRRCYGSRPEFCDEIQYSHPENRRLTPDVYFGRNQQIALRQQQEELMDLRKFNRRLDLSYSKISNGYNAMKSRQQWAQFRRKLVYGNFAM